MQAIILAAGKSTRTHPLTLHTPKALLPVANRPILEHNLRQLAGLVDEAVIIVGFGSEQIMDRFGSRYGKIALKYAVQKNQDGTASALLAAEKAAAEKFLVLMGDDVYTNADIKLCLKHDNSMLVKQVDDIRSFGAVQAENGVLTRIDEKPTAASPGLANAGLYLLTKDIFSCIRAAKKSSRNEFELTDAVSTYAKNHPIIVEEASLWIPVSYPWSLLDASEAVLDTISGDVNATVEKGVTIRGNVIVGKNTLLRSGTYIEGPAIIGEGCDIGPNCYIRPYTAIGNGCRVGNAVEVKASILMDNVSAGHLSYIGDSIIGPNSNLGGGFLVANLRHDNGEVKSMVKGTLLITGRRKFGAIVGENVKTGVRTTIYPGRKIWPGKTTLPGEIVTKDIS
jgi:UDP-N-acetylglucosamine diphosphorylase / glucose-1-phosphate thymidylyltransferase / UDP-N-acetylgalactosamine diphosphorylase / glucosamine-1-phosphate N-acetyltransferase / galactosamine-1-phosphate N-acetyltransferase